MNSEEAKIEDFTISNSVNVSDYLIRELCKESKNPFEYSSFTGSVFGNLEPIQESVLVSNSIGLEDPVYVDSTKHSIMEDLIESAVKEIGRDLLRDTPIQQVVGRAIRMNPTTESFVYISDRADRYKEKDELEIVD